MLLYELYKVLDNNVAVLIYDRRDIIIYYGLLSNLDLDSLQCVVTRLGPLSENELVLKIDE